MIQTLDNLKPGCLAAVLDAGDGRLQEMGLVPGAPVEVLASGSTLLLRVGEQRLCLRKEAAEAVVVLPAF